MEGSMEFTPDQARAELAKRELSRRGTPLPSSDGGDYWGDVGNNVVQGVKEGIQNAPASAKSMFPMVSGMTKAVSGEIPNISDMNDIYQGVKNNAPGMFKGAWQGVKDTGKAAVMPLEMMSGTPASETMAGRTFRQRPISTVAGVAGTAAPLFGAGRAAFATEGPNFLESAGARGMLKDAGIGEDTIGNLTKRGAAPGQIPPNPVDIGENLGGELAKKGIVGQSGKNNFNNFMKEKMSAGQAVRDAGDAIRKANSGLGVYPELEDSLKVQSVPTLKPIIDEANQIAASGYDRPAARMMKRLYDNLQTKANDNDGFLTIDHVDEELNNVGKLFGNAGRGTDKWNMVAKVYGKLAGIRENMVSDIAERTGDPNLKNNFLKSNANYSKLMRIEPDIRSAANAEAVKSPFEGMKHPVDATHQFIAKGVYNAGKAARRIFEPMKGGVSNEKGSIFPGQEDTGGSTEPSSKTLPIYKPGQRMDPHAVFQGNFDLGDGKVYSTYIIKGKHPRAGSNFGSEQLHEMGIPIAGAEGKGIGQTPDIFPKAQASSPSGETYYHVTLNENTPSIMKRGLLPGQESPGSLEAHQPGYVFLTKDIEHAKTMANQFDEAAGSEGNISKILKVNLPKNHPIEVDPMDGYPSYRTHKPIHPKHIQHLTSNE